MHFARVRLTSDRTLHGYTGRILRVNLTTRETSENPLSETDAKNYLGGRGLAVKVLYSELKAGIDPLGPDNKLVYATGPLSATGFPLNSRWLVAAKSPLTGIYGESTCGGSFAVQLRKAGYDALVVEGRSTKPVYLGILDDEVEIKDASHIWGKLTLDTELEINHDLGLQERREDYPAILEIGPAGENLVRFAAIMHTAHRAAGRVGMGAVMGSKRLKAITVRGSGEIPIARPKRLLEISRQVTLECVTNPNIASFTKHGQAGFVRPLQLLGMLPTRNFQQGTFEHYEDISGETMTRTILKNRNTCAQCPVKCKREVEILEGPQGPVMPQYGGPEYESDAALGSLLMIGNLKFISRANQLCNAYGLDTISTGVIIAWLMECYERGIVTKKHLDGIEAVWGDGGTVLSLIEKIVKRDGAGWLLGEGIRRAAKIIGRGSERYAVEVKGLEIPMHEPRAKKGLGLSYATSVRGGCHVQSFHDTELETPNAAQEIGISKALDRHDTSREKVDAIRRSQDWVAVTNSLLYCTSPGWTGFTYTQPSFTVDALNAVTGWNLEVKDLLLAGERMNNLCRCFSAREGITRKDD